MGEKPSFIGLLPSYAVQLLRIGILSSVIFFVVYPYYNNFYYTVISKYFNNNDALYFTVVMTLFHMICYWTINGFFLFCDYTNFLSQYKLPRLKYQIPDWKLIKTTMIKGLIGQLTVEPLGTYFIMWPLMVKNGALAVYDETKGNLALEMDNAILNWDLIMFCKYSSYFIFCTMLNSWLFYVFHRILHHPKLYGMIHKQHHEYKGTIGFAAEYAHPVESLLANIVPTFIGCILVGAHPLLTIVWLLYRLEETYEAHSGYSFYNTFLHKIGFTHSDSALFHDFHHSRNIGNYGMLEADLLFGTDRGWNEWITDWKSKQATKEKNV